MPWHVGHPRSHAPAWEWVSYVFILLFFRYYYCMYSHGDLGNEEPLTLVPILQCGNSFGVFDLLFFYCYCYMRSHGGPWEREGI